MPDESERGASAPPDEPRQAEPAQSAPTPNEPPVTEPVSLRKRDKDEQTSPPAADQDAEGDPDAAVTDAAVPAGSPWQRYRRRRVERKSRPRRKAPWWELPALVLLAIVIAILVKTFVIQPFYIPSDSMENTLKGSDTKGHDRILVNKPIYDFRDPEPGDIVVFDAPPGWDTETTSKPPSNIVLRGVRGFGQLIGFVPPDGEVLVKRVIATGGQTVRSAPDDDRKVQVSDDGGKHYRTLSEPYVLIDLGETPSFGPVTIPKGRLWVMGDHRSDSEDSRYHCNTQPVQPEGGGTCDPKSSTVPIDNVIGKAFVVAWPPSHWRTLGTPATFDAAAAPVVPAAASVLTVVPIWLVRRRRRRR